MVDERNQGNHGRAPDFFEWIGRHKVTNLDGFFEKSPFAVMVISSDQEVVYTNGEFEVLFGYEREEVIGMSVASLFHYGKVRTEAKAAAYAVLRGETVSKQTERHNRFGEAVPVTLYAYPLRSETGVSGAVVAYLDRRQDVANEETVKLFEMSLRNISDGVMITEQDGTILWVNRAFEVITGYTSEEAIGNNPRLLNAGVHSKAFFRQMWKALEDRGVWRGDIWNRRKSGSVYRQRLSVSKFRGSADERLYIAVIHELSDLDDMQDKLTILETTDPVTGLPNRPEMRKLIERKVNHSDYISDRFAVLTIEITNFNEMNDTLGHKVGDRLLIDIAKRLMLLVNDESQVGRIGGDDFLIVHDQQAGDLEPFLEKLVTCLEKPFFVDDSELFIHPSIGVSRFPEDCEETQNLFMTSNVAMTHARESVVDHISYFSTEKAEELKRRFEIANHLKGAGKREEWALHYQPIVDLESGELKKAEALIRWSNKDLGIVSPGEFIPIAEKTGQIIAIGEWVLDEVFRQLIKWGMEGLVIVPVSVNLSIRQLEQENFAESLLKRMRDWRIPADYLQVEITESMTKGNIGRIMKNLNRLTRAGVRVAIDDFGKGYSSFSHLTELGLSELKVDQHFIKAMRQETETEKLLRAMLLVADGLGLDTVAEGVETDFHHEKVKALGFTLGQGYYYAKPLPEKDFRNWLE
ncbi:sensor domain-containing protein [Salisediminibacterium selenitireducens]|uniref:Diguanylate cyclase/phosphodiesterase with PAS/PAC sensor(S) n=1 Tax=Bacillus selenitireducens (strain ATCC 700615 / DSM 15326 / MLS10) TaxID=439292 RepID=D6Y0T0_BACIE|nr:bifunctional diguanylate cyclase/phosphodiesterase [Salisediminibacterium selenitireducens]ADI00648.1 diguanylate cyclase/phosphodiesterase with PAS/PAC sensor(s) [[Bacillus] selenitireducens MLS10]